jgi:hypothetical protein
MAHVDHYRNGVKLVSATEIPGTVLAKSFLDKWRTKLCHCLTHAGKPKKLKPAEKAIINATGSGHCGLVYADKVKDAAADLGTAVHKIVEEYLEGVDSDDKPAEAYVWASKIVALLREHSVKPVLIKPESTLIDEESNLAGSPDLVAEWDGRPEIVDYKIKNSLDEFTGVQGWVYRYLIRRQTGVDIRYMRILWCKKESAGKLVEPVLIDLDEWAEPTKALIVLWNRLYPSRRVTLHELPNT